MEKPMPNPSSPNGASLPNGASFADYVAGITLPTLTIHLRSSDLDDFERERIALGARGIRSISIDRSTPDYELVMHRLDLHRGAIKLLTIDPHFINDSRIRAILEGLCIELILVATADHDQETLQALEVLRRRFPRARVVVV